MKFFILNTKGGCGKTTTAVQILAPYCFSKNNLKPIVYDLDTMNGESTSYLKTEIFEHKKVERLTIDHILTESDVIFDSGAGKNGEESLNQLIETGMFDQIDNFVIPLTSGSESAVDALNVYNSIIKNKSDARILFVFSDCIDPNDFPLSIQFSAFYDSFNTTSETASEKYKLFIIERKGCIVWSQMYGKIAYEIGNENTRNDKLKLLEQLISNNRDKNSINETSEQLILINRCIKFRHYLEKNIFVLLDEFIGDY